MECPCNEKQKWWGLSCFELEHFRSLIPAALDLIGPDRSGGKRFIAEQLVDMRGGGGANNQFIRHGTNGSMTLVAPAESGGRDATGEKRNDDSIKKFHARPIWQTVVRGRRGNNGGLAQAAL